MSKPVLKALSTPSDRIQKKTFENGYNYKMVGRLCYAHVPALNKKSVDDKQVPAILLNCAPRNRVYIIHATDKDLGFRCTSAEWTQIRFPTNTPTDSNYWAFTQDEIDNLRIQKYMKVPFATKLLSEAGTLRLAYHREEYTKNLQVMNPPQGRTAARSTAGLPNVGTASERSGHGA